MQLRRAHSANSDSVKLSAIACHYSASYLIVPALRMKAEHADHLAPGIAVHRLACPFAARG